MTLDMHWKTASSHVSTKLSRLWPISSHRPEQALAPQKVDSHGTL